MTTATIQRKSPPRCIWAATAFLTALLSPSAQPAIAAEAQPSRPNVLFLLADDQRPDTIAALGNETIQTPNLDRLVREGLAFTRAISPNPLCVPSRAEILTGCSGFRNGVLPGFSNELNPDLVLWPAAMRRAGYETWCVGKWHTTGRPSSRGYTDSLGLYSGGGKAPTQYDAHGREVTGYRGWVFQTDDRTLFPERGVGLTPNISSDFADAAIELLKRKPSKPFFLHVNFTAPHDPLLWPPGYENKYKPADIPLPKNFRPEHPFDHGNARGRDELLLPFPRTEQDVREDLAVYYAVVSHLDAQVGRILAALDETGQAENTIVVFSSDHGLAIGSHGLRGKQNMYEHTVGVPLILRGPGIPRGQRSNAQVYLRELYPTLCDLAGVEIPETVEAPSFAPVVRGEKESIHEAAFCYFNNSQRMVRTDRYKLIHYPQIGRYQLFDLAADPWEMRNLLEAPVAKASAAIFDQLSAKLRKLRQQAGDPLPAGTN